MTLSSKQLHNLPVYTRSGAHLGFVVGFDLDELEQKITQYRVKTRQGITGLFESELLISTQQVISLSTEKMIVDDLAQKQSVAEAAKLSVKGTLSAENQ